MLFFHAAGLGAVIRPGGGSPSTPETYGPSLAGQLLVAAPRMRDPRFRKSVILMVRHDKTGAFGLIINRVAGREKLAGLYAQLKIEPPSGTGEVSIHYGGPVAPGAAFVVHSIGPDLAPKFRIGDEIGVSPLDQVLRAMARGAKPRRTIFTAGYSGWGPGQLEGEINRGDWYTAPADIDIVFDEKMNTKWSRAKSRRQRTL